VPDEWSADYDGALTPAGVNMEIRFDRASLYDEVWTTPLTKLGAKYGVSDNAIRKICKVMSIPLPKAGHWAKLQAGQRVPKETLPVTSGPEFFICRPPPSPTEMTDAGDASWLAERLGTEAHRPIEFSMKQKRWHPVIAPYRERLRRAAADRVRRDTRVEKRQGRIHWQNDGPDFEALKVMFDGPFLTSRHHRSSFRVSVATVERALALANTLALSAAARGFRVESRDDSLLTFTMERANFVICFRERQDKVARPIIASAPQLGTRNNGIPTDRLALVIELMGSTFEIVDSPKATIDSRLHEVFPRLFRDVVRWRAHVREEQAQEARRAAHAVEAAAAALKQKKIQLEAEAEKAKRAALFDDVSRSQHSLQIRDYVKRVAEAAPEVAPEGLAIWMRWALAVADELDPLPRTISALTGSRSPSP